MAQLCPYVNRIGASPPVRFAATAQAAPSDPGAGQVVTPDPIPARILPSGSAGRARRFLHPATAPRHAAACGAQLHLPAGDGSGPLFVNDTRGKLWAIDRTTGRPSCSSTCGRARRAFPDGHSTDRPAQLRLPSGFRPTRAARLRQALHRQHRDCRAARRACPCSPAPIPAYLDDVVAEWRLDARSRRGSTPARAVRSCGSASGAGPQRRPADVRPERVPGSAGYGKMFIGIGDGGNSPITPTPTTRRRTRQRARQDPAHRPAQAGRRQPYGVPQRQPLRRPGRLLPEIWALGLRHPQNICFDRGGDRRR